MIVEEELDGIDIDDIRNLEDLLRIVFIHEECGNLNEWNVDGNVGILTLIDVHSVANVIEESI